MDNDQAEPLPVIINLHTWLLPTENWIFTQTAHLSAGIDPYVVCVARIDRGQFPVERLFAYGDLSKIERMRTLCAATKSLGTSLGRKSALIARVAERYDVRLVHSHFGHTAYYAANAISKLGLRHVVTFYGVDMSALPSSDRRWIDRYRHLFERVDQVLCEGPRMADRIQALGCPVEKIQIHHLGVNLSRLPFRPRTWRRGEPLKVLISASFREKKGIPYALAALAQVREAVPIEITVIGDAHDHPDAQREKARIYETVEREKLAPNVRFLGYQPHAALLREAYEHHIFVSPSVTADNGDTEGGAPVTIIEMAATGMPVVSTFHADIPEVIVHGSGGLLAEERDIEGLVGHILYLAKHQDSWETIGRAARARVESLFSADIQGRALSAVYRRIAHGRAFTP